MTVEIKELVVRAVVNSDDTGGAPEGAVSDEDRQSIVEEAVREVMRILRKNKDR